eukprot:s655_g6.t1
MSESSGGTSDGQVPTQLTYLVPQFDPSQHDLEQYSQKVEMLSEIWPAGKINELITRLILNTSGVAFQKLQLQRSELLTGDKKGVAKLITILGGQWGKVSLEKKYETFERAELQAYTVLRGSQLSSEDKKRVVLESEASESGKLEMSKVTAAVRMLGSGFFHDVTGVKKAKGKVYDAHALVVEEAEGFESAMVAEEWSEEDLIEHLAAEGDEDAVLICEFETAVQDAIQDDEELAIAYNAYTDARKRLSERNKNRGFWPNYNPKGKSKGGKGKGKTFSKGSRKSLQQRILESHCRHCGRRGHWRAECPDRLRGTPSSGTTPQATTMSVSTDTAVGDPDAMMPMEFMILPEISEHTNPDTRMHFAYVNEPKPRSEWNSSNAESASDAFHAREPAEVEPIMFASHSSFGILDSDRLMKVSQNQESEESLETFKNKSLEEMGQYTVTFGKTHLGKPYIEVWSSQMRWLQWFTKTYEGSAKVEHQKLLHYTALMIERAELEMGEDAQQQPVRPVPKTKAMPKAKSLPMPTAIDLEDDDLWLAAEMESQPSYVVDHMTQESMSALQGRMSQVENALGEILNHIRTNNS